MVNVKVVESIKLDACSPLAWAEPASWPVSWLCIVRAVLNANWSGCYEGLYSIPIVKVFGKQLWQHCRPPSPRRYDRPPSPSPSPSSHPLAHLPSVGLR